MDQGALIDLVRQYEHIYNKKHREFKNKLSRENAWKTIALIMNHSREEVETTWNTLRNRFVTERRKMRNIPTGSAAKTDWRYYDAMSFLEEHVAIKKTVRNIAKQNVQDTQSTSLEVESQQQLDSDTHSCDGFSHETPEDCNWESADLHSIPSQSVSVSTQTLPSSSRASSRPAPDRSTESSSQHQTNIQEMKKYKRKKNNCQDIESSIVATLSTIENVVKVSDEDNNEDMLFAKSIGESLKLIKNRKIKAKIKLEIFSILEKYEE